jgi:hypothetical protein
MLLIGFDPRELPQYLVAKESARSFRTGPMVTAVLSKVDLIDRGLYTRETRYENGQMYDVISNAPMSTDFSIARFFAPLLAEGNRFVVFVDCDVMFRCSPARLIEAHQPGKAVSVVKHIHEPTTTVKMDNQLQTRYARKNWSSVMVFDTHHPKIKGLTPEFLNSATGLELHTFSWLDDSDIGELSPEWNYLVGYTPHMDNPYLVHWTEGAPNMKGYENAEFADEFWEHFARAIR